MPLSLGISLDIDSRRPPGIEYSPLANSATTALWQGDAGVLSDAAAVFGGVNQSLSVASNPSLQTGDVDFGVCGWVYSGSISATYHGIVSKGAEWGLTGYDNSFGFYLNGRVQELVSSGNRIAGSLQFVLAWYDSVANTINIRVDNGSVESISHSGGVLSVDSETFLFGQGRGGYGFLSGRTDSFIFLKSPPGGIASVVSDINAFFWNGSAGRTLFEVTAEQKAAWGIVSGYPFSNLAAIGTDIFGSNDLTNNNSTTIGTGIAAGAAGLGDPSNWVDQKQGIVASNSNQAGRPALELVDVNGTDRRLLVWDGMQSLGLDTPILLNGEFTLYASGKPSAFWVPIGAENYQAAIAILSGNLYVIRNDDANVSTPYSGPISASALVRVRRDATGHIYVAATGMDEVGLGTLTGDLTINALGARPTPNLQFTVGAFDSILIQTADTVAAGTAARDLAWFAKRGFTL